MPNTLLKTDSSVHFDFSCLHKDIAKTVAFLPDSTIFRQGDTCTNYLLVKQGSIKVSTRADNGREMLLYHVGQGESCTLTTACLLAGDTYPAEGVTETFTEAYVITKKDFCQLLNQSESFRTYIFAEYGKRLKNIIYLVETVSFGRIDKRLANWLIDNNNQGEISTTHQNIATDLGTAREVISRQLKIFEKKGWLRLYRGKIVLILPGDIFQYSH